MHTKTLITAIVGVAGVVYAAPASPPTSNSQASGSSFSSSLHSDSDHPNPVGGATLAQWRQDGNNPPVGSVQSTRFGQPQQPGTNLLSSPANQQQNVPQNFQSQSYGTGAGTGVPPASLQQNSQQLSPAPQVNSQPGRAPFAGSPPPAWPPGHGIVSPTRNQAGPQQAGSPDTNGLSNLGNHGYPHGYASGGSTAPSYQSDSNSPGCSSGGGSGPCPGADLSSPQDLPNQQNNGPTLGGTGVPQNLPQQQPQSLSDSTTGIRPAQQPNQPNQPNSLSGGAGGGNPPPQLQSTGGSGYPSTGGPSGSLSGGLPLPQGGSRQNPFGSQGPPSGLNGDMGTNSPIPGINTNGQPRNVPLPLANQLLLFFTGGFVGIDANSCGQGSLDVGAGVGGGAGGGAGGGGSFGAQGGASANLNSAGNTQQNSQQGSTQGSGD